MGKIRAAATDEKLWVSAFIARHLDLWARIRGEAEVKIWIEQHAKTRERAMTLALAYTNISFVNTDEYPRFDAGLLERYVDLTMLAGLTEGVNGYSALPNRQREAAAVLMLRDARNRKKDGKPYAKVHLHDNDPTSD